MPNHHLPVLVCSDEDIDFIYSIQPHCDFRFSTNPHEIWPTDEWGYSREGSRRYLFMTSPLLAQCHALVTRLSPIGARFRIDLERRRVVLCRTQQTIAVLDRQTA